MQGLADGYFILPYTIGDYLATAKFPAVKPEDPAVHAASDRGGTAPDRHGSWGSAGRRPADDFHQALGKVMWDNVGMGRNKKGLDGSARRDPEDPRGVLEGCQGGRVGEGSEHRTGAGRPGGRLPRAGRAAREDALHREESCGGHFREEYQTEEGEAKRDDKRVRYVAAWEYAGEKKPPTLHKEPLDVRIRETFPEELQVMRLHAQGLAAEEHGMTEGQLRHTIRCATFLPMPRFWRCLTS